MNNDTTVKLTGATKYRVGTRERLTNEGWKFVQREAGVDEYTKNGVVAHIKHGAKNTMTSAEIIDGKTPPVVINDGQLKLERAIAALLLGDENKATPWYMTEAELAALPPLGKGNGLIKTAADFGEPVKEATSKVVSPEAKPVPKPAPRKASARKSG